MNDAERLELLKAGDTIREQRDEIERLRAVLKVIADEDWVENCLDPQRPARLAKAVLAGEQ